MFTASDIIHTHTHTHTRADLIEDGDLVDVSTLAREAGFKVPVAVTRAVWADCVAWSQDDTKRKRVPQDEEGRLWDVLFMARNFAARNAQGNRVPFALHRVPREGKGHQARIVTLHMHIGGDNGEPVITIMQPTED
ncbi:MULTISPECIES: DUF6573 family protein [Xanthomonas]|uniref:DUF6573 family protein n=1 Tax=Xanthomonas TaxID=338 RepID=UPI0009383E1A|nr:MULTISPECIES: DUF6573 family protein [Xanthomonas]APO88989.1 hypothetical protein BJD11_02045 [Xanthomonas euvesicatoria]MCC8516577.1 hypothetical protein [Xanthomonas euvesicatoria pv. euvesicatoria]